MATHSSVPAWRIPGTEELGGLPSMESHRVRHDWSDLAAAAAAAAVFLNFPTLSIILESVVNNLKCKFYPSLETWTRFYLHWALRSSSPLFTVFTHTDIWTCLLPIYNDSQMSISLNLFICYLLFFLKKDFEGEYDKNMQLWKKKMSIFIKIMSTFQAFRVKKLISKTANYA